MVIVPGPSCYAFHTPLRRALPSGRSLFRVRNPLFVCFACSPTRRSVSDDGKRPYRPRARHRGRFEPGDGSPHRPALTLSRAPKGGCQRPTPDALRALALERPQHPHPTQLRLLVTFVNGKNSLCRCSVTPTITGLHRHDLSTRMLKYTPSTQLYTKCFLTNKRFSQR